METLDRAGLLQDLPGAHLLLASCPAFKHTNREQNVLPLESPVGECCVGREFAVRTVGNTFCTDAVWLKCRAFCRCTYQPLM